MARFTRTIVSGTFGTQQSSEESSSTELVFHTPPEKQQQQQDEQPAATAATSPTTMGNNRKNKKSRGSRKGSGLQRFQLSLRAENLPNTSFFRTASPYATVEIVGGPQDGTVLGQTEVIKKSLSPDWCEILFLETSANIHMPLRVTLWDQRGDDSLPPISMATAEFEATAVYQSPGKTQTDSIGKRGKLHIHIEESFVGDLRGKLKLQLRGLDMKNVEPGPFGLGRSDPFFEIAKKNADHHIATVNWNVVYRSEHIDNNLNPYWDPTVIDLEKLCFGQADWPLKISVWDHNSNGNHVLIGEFETNLPHMQERISIKGNADRDQAVLLGQQVKTNNKTYGLLVVLKAEILHDDQNPV
mmetsp:Transcript_1969/g.4851  ORF Transcript_1969/g.4851 Transcript_1969/m.4851 type:complete len:356 (-) Transcript_1969:212-1279(-)